MAMLRMAKKPLEAWPIHENRPFVKPPNGLFMVLRTQCLLNLIKRHCLE
jgi:hypothetical protein